MGLIICKYIAFGLMGLKGGHRDGSQNTLGIMSLLSDMVQAGARRQQGNSVARDLPPTGSEANTTIYFDTPPPPPTPRKLYFLKMLEMK